MYKVLVVGGGYWAEKYIQNLGANVVGCVEVNEKRAEYLRQTYNIKVFEKLNHINFPNFDYAIIATPPQTHIELALEILKLNQRCKLLIEKPLAASYEEGYKLVRCKEQIMVGHIYLYHPVIEKLKQNLPSVHHIFSRWTNNGPVRTWQNAIWDLGPHPISITNYLLNSTPIVVAGQIERDWASFSLTYNGIEAVNYVSWVGGPKVRQVEIVPSDGSDRIIFDDLKQVFEVTPMQRMLNAFLTGDRDDRCSFEKGMDVVKVLENLDD